MNDLILLQFFHHLGSDNVCKIYRMGFSENVLVVTLFREKQSLEMIEAEAGGNQSACILNGPHQSVSFSKANTGNILYSKIILMVGKNNSRAHVTCGDMLPNYVMRL